MTNRKHIPTDTQINNARFGRLPDACKRFGVGETTMRKLGSESNGIIHYGRVALFDYAKIDEFLLGLAE